MQTELERIADRAKAAREAHPGYAEASRKRAKAATETATVAETATGQPQAPQMPAKTFKAPPPPNTPRRREMVSESTTAPSRATRSRRVSVTTEISPQPAASDKILTMSVKGTQPALDRWLATMNADPKVALIDGDAQPDRKSDDKSKLYGRYTVVYHL